MIAGVWPGDTPGRAAICADWLELPFADATFDFVVGDGCLVLLDFPEGYRQLASSVRRCMAPGGSFLLRIFCRPQKVESLDEIADALKNHAIGSFDAFKWRLAMAVQGDDVASGALMSAVWQAWKSLVPDTEIFAFSQGWPLEKVQVIDVYRDSATRYYFPALEEVRAVFSPVLKEVRSLYGHYELAERCPHVLFRRADD
jgi:SAM-dependent methyltransferase